jgi:hypothetical protein
MNNPGSTVNFKGDPGASSAEPLQTAPVLHAIWEIYGANSSGIALTQSALSRSAGLTG